MKRTVTALFILTLFTLLAPDAYARGFRGGGGGGGGGRGGGGGGGGRGGGGGGGGGRSSGGGGGRSSSSGSRASSARSSPSFSSGRSSGASRSYNTAAGTRSSGASQRGTTGQRTQAGTRTPTNVSNANRQGTAQQRSQQFQQNRPQNQQQRQQAQQQQRGQTQPGRQEQRQGTQQQRQQTQQARQQQRQQTQQGRQEGRTARTQDRQQGMTQRQQQRQQYANKARNNYWNHHDDWGRHGWYGWGGYGWGANNWWGPLAWGGVAGFVGGLTGSLVGNAIVGEPVAYSYSSPGYSEYSGGDTIIVNDVEQPAQQYAQEAYTIANNYDTLTQPTAVETSATGAAAELDWKPLGIYAAPDPSGADPHQFYQLVLSNDGAIGGTYRDTQTNAELPIKGALDPKSQRVAFSVGDQSLVIETGLYNLTQPEAPVLVHVGTEKSYQSTLIRMEQPSDQAQPTSAEPLPPPAQ